MLKISREIQIPIHEFELTYARSSGPGGQNVNKVNSKALLRWNLLTSPSLDEFIRERLRMKLAHRLNREGEILISSDVYRDQIRNREECFERLRALLAEAAFEPKKRKKSRPSYSSQQRVKEGKRRNSAKKSHRRFSGDHD